MARWGSCKLPRNPPLVFQTLEIQPHGFSKAWKRDVGLMPTLG